MSISTARTSTASTTLIPVKHCEPIEASHRAMQLANWVDKFIRKLEKNPTVEPIFDVELNIKGEPRLCCDNVGMELRRLLRSGAATLPRRYQKERFSPRVMLFANMARRHDLHHFDDTCLVDTFNNVKRMARRLQRFAKALIERTQSGKYQ